MNRWAPLAAAVLVLVGAAATGSAGRAATAAPEAGWWSRTNLGLPSDPGAPPDVGRTDLYVAGGGASGTSVSQAVAAVRAALPPEARVRTLRLAIKGTPPGSVTVRACAATSNWKPAQGGNFADAPTSDCTKSAAGTVVGTDLVFDHVGDLVAPGAASISVVLLPGTADRIVLVKPTATAFDIAPVSPVPEAVPPPSGPGPEESSSPVPDASAPAVAESPTGPSLAAPSPADGATTPDVGSPVARPPADGLAAPPGGAARPSGRQSAPPHPTDDRVRAAAALVVICLLAGYTAVDRHRPKRGPRAIGPFARGATPALSAVAAERGIGRFRQARQGRPARL